MTDTFKRPTRDEAIRELQEMGAVLSKREDRFDDTKSGWWIDGVCFGLDPVRALISIKFGS